MHSLNDTSCTLNDALGTVDIVEPMVPGLDPLPLSVLRDGLARPLPLVGGNTRTTIHN